MVEWCSYIHTLRQSMAGEGLLRPHPSLRILSLVDDQQKRKLKITVKEGVEALKGCS